eukprot:306509-Chlamydomonas_euryale.AAC.2
MSFHMHVATGQLARLVLLAGPMSLARSMQLEWPGMAFCGNRARSLARPAPVAESCMFRPEGEVGRSCEGLLPLCALHQACSPLLPFLSVRHVYEYPMQVDQQHSRVLWLGMLDRASTCEALSRVSWLRAQR